MSPSKSKEATVRWRVHLSSPPETVYSTLATSEGRAKFWAESAEEKDGTIDFIFPNGEKWQGRILETVSPQLFSVQYYGGSITTFELRPDGKGGTDLSLTDKGVPDKWRIDVTAGWVSVLLALKAAVDFNIDLRNHDPGCTWDQGYVDN